MLHEQDFERAIMNGALDSHLGASDDIPWPDDADPANERAAGNVAHSAALPETVSAMDLFDAEVRELKPLLHCVGSGGLLPPGLNLFVAKPKIGKSWLALQIAIMIAGGPHPEGMRPAQTGPVVFFALEESTRRTALRLRKLAMRGTWLRDLTFCYDLLPLQGGGAEQLEALIEKHSPRLVIIDTLSALAKNAKQTGDVFRAQYNEITLLRKITERHNLAVLLIHHTRKQTGGDVVESVAGTGGLSAAADCLMMLSRKPEGHYELEVLGREVEEASYALKFEREGSIVPFGWRVIGDAGAESATQAQAAVLQALAEDGPMSPAQLATAAGVNRSTVRSILRRLVQSQQITKEKGKYACCTSLSQTLSKTTDATGETETVWD